MKNLIDRFFKKKVANKEYVIEEIAPNVIEKTIDTNLPKFMDIDLEAIQKRNKGAKWHAPFDNSPTGKDFGKPDPIKSKLPPIFVKINLPNFDDPDLHFLGNSESDGFPIFRFIGDDPTTLRKYPYEELHNFSAPQKPIPPKTRKVRG